MVRLLNDGWRFAKTAPDARPAEGDFAPVALPHDWLIHQSNHLYESSDGWYRRLLFVEKSGDGLHRRLRFDGVYMDCEVRVNGSVCCIHRYGYTAFDAVLDGLLHDGDNEIQVLVRHRSPSSRWYSGAGIFRDVTYHQEPADRIAPDGVYVHTEETARGWLVHIDTEVIGEGTPVHRLLDADGRVVCQGASPLRVAEPRRWSPADPYLYTLETRLGTEILRQRIGLRTVRLDPAAGCLINGRPVRLHGVCLHHDLGLLGAAFHPKAARRQLVLMKRMGVNAIRTAHNPPAKAVMALCDELGLMVVSESFDMWTRPKTAFDYARFFPDCWAEDVAAWVRRDRNHPSLIMWSIGNEIVDTHVDGQGLRWTQRLMAEVRRHDPCGNGQVTLGSNYMPWENTQKCAEILKNAGYNYAEKLYASHHAAHPDWFIYGSETASLVHSRGVYHFPADTPILAEEDLQCSALGNSRTSWGTQDICRLIVDDLRTACSAGQFLWSGVDYIGEPTPYHTRSSYFGYADTAGFTKDLYHLFRAAWQREPVVHIGVHWDWNDGQMIDVPVMTNAASAELLLNGASLGRKAVSFDHPETALPMWRVPFAAGTLTALAYDGQGNVIGQTSRVTPGDSTRLVMRCEDTALYATGEDMAFIEIGAVDKCGHPVENACDRVTVSVTGAGVLLGLDNGDSTDEDGYRTDARRLFSGKLLAMAAALAAPGEICVTASAPGLISAELRIPVLPALRREGIALPCACPHDGADAPVHARRIELIPLTPTELSPDQPEAVFTWRVHPAGAMAQEILWQATNAAGIDAGCAELHVEGDCIRVRGKGDGVVYLRAMARNGANHARIISQREICISGMGRSYLDPYGFVSGGLFDHHAGGVTPGNERGVAFARDGRSMAGFTGVDFGPDGSDEITLPVFALDGDAYEIELYDGDALIARLPYQKPSHWNVYQPETWRLPVRLRGVHTLRFAMGRKIHLKGFSFTRQSRAFLPLTAGEADAVYGDSFRMDGTAVRDIGNNVTLRFDRMDFGDCRHTALILRGATAIPQHPITLRLRNDAGGETVSVLTYAGGAAEQRFSVETPGGACTAEFVFLPGSQFDFEALQFTEA